MVCLRVDLCSTKPLEKDKNNKKSRGYCRGNHQQQSVHDISCVSFDAVDLNIGRFKLRIEKCE
jgi:hypothetical protein